MTSKKEEAIVYFQRVLAQKRAVVHKIQEIIVAVRDPEIKGPLEDVFRTELRHHSLAVLIYSILQGVSQEEIEAYAFMRQLLDAIRPMEGQNQRRYLREPVLGIVHMRDRGSAFRCEVKCMDFSLGGLGIESEYNISKDHIYELEINLYGRSVPLERNGKLVWMKQVIPGTFFGGIQFTES